jgi:hypothetical protein
MSKEERKKSLVDLVGEKLASAKRKDAQDATDMLDGLGVVRKDFSLTIKAADTQQIVERVAERINSALEQKGILMAAAKSGEADIQDADEGSKVVAEAALEVLQELAEEESSEEPEEQPEDEPEDEEVEKSLAVTVADQTEAIKALTDVVADQYEDQGEMAQRVATVAKMAPIVQELAERLETLENLAGLRPRQASKAQETTFDNEDVEAEALKSIAGDVDRFLGIPVKRDNNDK